MTENTSLISNLLDIYASVTDQSVAELVSAYEGKMYGHLKVDLAEAVTQRLEPICTRALELLDDPAELIESWQSVQIRRVVSLLRC